MKDNSQTVKVSDRIREFLDKNSEADMEKAITFSAADALRLFSCFQRLVIINEISMSLLGQVETVSLNDALLLKHHTKELQGQAEGFILSTLDKFMENDNE